MSAPQWTPGPWKFNGAVQTMDGAYICDLSSPRGAAERDATGHLIAAAPDLYEALERIGVEVFPHPNSAHVYIDTIRAVANRALAKARGEPA